MVQSWSRQIVCKTLSRKKIKTKIKKKAGGATQGVGSEFKSQYYKKKITKF
jgi:hypothetical protein